MDGPADIKHSIITVVVFSEPRRKPAGGPSFVVILAALACIMALMLPLQGDGESRLPDYLHLSVNQKLIAAYVLGRFQAVPFIYINFYAPVLQKRDIMGNTCFPKKLSDLQL